MQLSPHFRLAEFASPRIVDGKTLRDPGNRVTPPGGYHANLRQLCAALEVIRTAIGDRPIRVISGWRSVSYNAANPGRAPNSQHLYGRAADIRVAGLDTRELFWVVADLQRDAKIPLGGLAYYERGDYVHYDIRGHAARWKPEPKRP